MTTTIAISGKGGSGKTTLAAMFVRLLAARKGGSVLAVDADPNSCLGLTLGVPPVVTVAQLREQSRLKQPHAGMDKVRSFEYDIQQAVAEADGFDLLTMGRPEGPNCYCAVNNLLRQFLNKLAAAYHFVVIDNEAGMEHLSRRTTNNVELLCIVAEPTPLGTETARRIYELTKSLPISVKQIGIIWNNTTPARQQPSDNKKLSDMETLGSVLFDQSVYDAAMRSKTIFDIEDGSIALSAVSGILDKTLNLKNLSPANNSKPKTQN
jgi:CO dehydrogenase maturation factor